MDRLDDLLEELGEDAVREILSTFAEDATITLSAMRAAAALGDTRALYRAAHSVAGSAGNVGANELARRARGFERDIGSSGPAAIDAEIRGMQAALDATLKELGLT